MRAVVIAFSAFLLGAAAPGAQPERPPQSQPVQADWLRGGREPEAVFGPHRLAVSAIALASAAPNATCGRAQRCVVGSISLL